MNTYSTQEDISPENRSYTELVAKHLADHYMTGQFGMGHLINMKPMSKADRLAMASGYQAAVKFAVTRFEDALWTEVKQYFGIAKVSKGLKKPEWKRVSDILKYKTIGKTKNAVRRYLYS